ncbi:hypothetical protein CICLE_v10009838mg [Citrus x clementina]|uniref:Transcription factor TFIIIC triple barrel domain-containing protein n=1 Tax=Citrus clementina TaxID=85681 RepID=V4WF16_CITCL|nr:uncharacterized protein LOC18054204 isoform X1 [Citrus x clementina]ESR65159.1 hypothetical protein CICLE_v10009838mg [Citrus x clementina]
MQMQCSSRVMRRMMKKNLLCLILMFYLEILISHQMRLMFFLYVGLDTLNPVLVIDNKIKLIGEYEETIGTCFAFAEDEAAPMVHEEAGSSELNLFSGKCIIDSNQAPRKQVKPVARLHKILKFRILLDGDVQNRTTGPSV